MEAAPLVTLIAVGLAIAVIAAFLITVIYQLYNVFSRLNTVLDVVGQVVEKTEALEPIVGEIADDLLAGQGAVEAAVERLKVRTGYDPSGNGGPGEQPAVEPVPAGPPPTTSFTNY